MSFANSGPNGGSVSRRLTATLGPPVLRPLSSSQTNVRQSIASFVPHSGYNNGPAAGGKQHGFFAPGQTSAMPKKQGGRMSLAGNGVQRVPSRASMSFVGTQTMHARNNTMYNSNSDNSGSDMGMAQPNHGRHSLAPSTFGRASLAPRQSLAGGAGAGVGTDMSMVGRGSRGSRGSKRNHSAARGDDPRNPGDRSYINRACHDIICFLVENHYDKDIDMKRLKSPLTRDFIDVFGFLVQCLDEHFQFADGDPRIPPNSRQKRGQQRQRGRPANRLTGRSGRRAGGKQNSNAADDQPEDPPMLAKRILEYLRYPSTLKDNAFKNIGISHTWKDVLAAMHWFVDLLRYVREKKVRDYEKAMNSANEETLLPDHDQDGEENRDLDLLLKFLPRAYQNFMSMEGDMHDEDAIAVVVEELHKKFEAQNMLCQQETDSMIEEINTMEQELNERYRDRPSQVVELQEKRDLFQEDIGKISHFIEELGAAIHDLRETQAKRSNELLHIQSEMDKYTHHKNEMLEQISRQELSPEEVRRMNHEVIKLEETLRSLQKRKSEQDKQLWQAESELHDVMETLRRTVAMYNQQAGLLGLLPYFSSPIAQQQNFDYEVVIDPARLDTFFDSNTGNGGASLALASNEGHHASITNVDLRQLKCNLRSLREQTTRHIHEAQNEALHLKEEADKACEQRQDKHDEIQALEKQLKKLEMEYKTEREMWRNRLQQIIFDTEEVEREVHQIKQDDTLLSQIEAQKATMKSLVDEYQHLERKFADDRREMARMLDQTCDLMARHKSHVEESLSVLERASERVLDQLTREDEDDDGEEAG